MTDKTFKLKSEIWLYGGDSAWHFMTVDKKTTAKIRAKFGHLSRGWSSLPVKVKLGRTVWTTSIFYDKQGVYLLPLKATIRKKEGLTAGQTTPFVITILV